MKHWDIAFKICRGNCDGVLLNPILIYIHIYPILYPIICSGCNHQCWLQWCIWSWGLYPTQTNFGETDKNTTAKVWLEQCHLTTVLIKVQVKPTLEETFVVEMQIQLWIHYLTPYTVGSPGPIEVYSSGLHARISPGKETRLLLQSKRIPLYLLLCKRFGKKHIEILKSYLGDINGWMCTYNLLDIKYSLRLGLSWIQLYLNFLLRRSLESKRIISELKNLTGESLWLFCLSIVPYHQILLNCCPIYNQTLLNHTV